MEIKTLFKKDKMKKQTYYIIDFVKTETQTYHVADLRICGQIGRVSQGEKADLGVHLKECGRVLVPDQFKRQRVERSLEISD